MPQAMIRPGRLILVVGPSGAGKDTVIGAARRALADDPSVVFPRRVVTRGSDSTEDVEFLDAAAFAEAKRRGKFALSWHAHGLDYGIRADIDAHLRAGKTVVINVSRGIVDAARHRYANVAAVSITAPEPVLRARLAARGRESGGVLEERLHREAPALSPDLTIENTSSPEAAASALIEWLCR